MPSAVVSPAGDGESITSPGKERWPVKTATDGDQGQVVDQPPTAATVEDMWLLDPIGKLPFGKMKKKWPRAHPPNRLRESVR